MEIKILDPYPDKKKTDLDPKTQGGSFTVCYCIVGWVDFGLFLHLQQEYRYGTGTPENGFIPFKSKENVNKKFDSVTASSLVPTFWIFHFIGVKTFFPTM
jgi:hypothetical protein